MACCSACAWALATTTDWSDQCQSDRASTSARLAAQRARDDRNSFCQVEASIRCLAIRSDRVGDFQNSRAANSKMAPEMILSGPPIKQGGARYAFQGFGDVGDSSRWPLSLDGEGWGEGGVPPPSNSLPPGEGEHYPLILSLSKDQKATKQAGSISSSARPARN